MPSTDVLIMAAGGGERFGSHKQFATFDGVPVLVHAVAPFQRSVAIDRITIVTTDADTERVARIAREHELDKVIGVVAGGDTRQASVRLGLDALAEDSDSVLVHDAARPNTSDELLARVLAALAECDAVVPALPVVDTLIRDADGKLDAMVDRHCISGVQTPQGFRTSLLRRAHRRALARGFVSSDDGSLVFALGEPVHTVPGQPTNIKITHAADVRIAEMMFALRNDV